ncbi:MAG: hypothetical protein ACETWE_14505 [Candidatus Bathyarchaeia archaeon]
MRKNEGNEQKNRGEKYLWRVAYVPLDPEKPLTTIWAVSWACRHRFSTVTAEEIVSDHWSATSGAVFQRSPPYRTLNSTDFLLIAEL